MYGCNDNLLLIISPPVMKAIKKANELCKEIQVRIES